MGNISDIIEEFLKNAIELSDNYIIEVQRVALAEKFQCVPSQINYVISTRFSHDKGYLVESKRGGGGYIRIKKLKINCSNVFYESLNNVIGFEIDQTTAIKVLNRLHEEKYMSETEYELIKIIIARETLNLPLPARDIIRANVMRAVTKIILSN